MPGRKPDPLDAMVGAKIRVLRVSRGLSQSDLADEIGVTFQQVQKYEKGVNRLAGSKLILVCDALNVKPEQILGNGTGIFSDNPDLLEPLRDNATARAFMAMSKLPRLQRIAVMHCMVMLVHAFTGNGKVLGERDE